MRTREPVCAAAIAIALALLSMAAVSAEEIANDEPFGRSVASDVLDGERGKASIPTAVLTAMGLDGTVQENLAQNTASGKNTITGGAFTNSAGLSTAIMNSGNNVLIQNATILLLDVH